MKFIFYALAAAILFDRHTEAISEERLKSWVTKFDLTDIDFETPFENRDNILPLTFTAAGESVTLDFKVSSRLFANNASGIPEGISNDLLEGTVRGQEADLQSYATLTLWPDGVTGRFSKAKADGVHELFHIDKLDGTRTTVIYRDEDIVGKNPAANGAGLARRSFARRIRKRQEAAPSTPASGKDCPIAIVADTTFANKFGEDAIKKMSSIMNDVQGIYSRAFDVGVPITLAVLDSNDTVGVANNGIGSTGDIQQALDKLADSVDRKVVLNEEQQKGVCLVHMFTSRDFGATLGLAFVATPEVDSDGGICQGKRGTGVTTSQAADKTDLPLSAWITAVAHEIGHNFGSNHDEDIGCANQKNLMAAAIDVGGPPVSTFSNCSLSAITEVLKTKATCFKSR